MKSKYGIYLIILTLLLFLVSAVQAKGQEERVIIKVAGLYCPFCSYGLEKHIKKIKGFSKIKINIKKGTAEVDFKPGTQVSKKSIETAVEDAGFSLDGLTWIKGGSKK